VDRHKITAYPDWVQTAQQRTSIQGAAYILKYLRSVCNIGSDIFVSAGSQSTYQSEVDSAMALANGGDSAGTTQMIQTSLIPKVADMVLPENKSVFHDILSQALYFLSNSGEYWCNPEPELLGTVPAVCTNVTIVLHSTAPISCIKLTISFHVEDIRVE